MTAMSTRCLEMFKNTGWPISIRMVGVASKPVQCRLPYLWLHKVCKKVEVHDCINMEIVNFSILYCYVMFESKKQGNPQ